MRQNEHRGNRTGVREQEGEGERREREENNGQQQEERDREKSTVQKNRGQKRQ